MKTNQLHRRAEIKAHVVALKLNGSLVQAIDREAEAEGLTRSAIIRRILKRTYSTTEPMTARA